MKKRIIPLLLIATLLLSTTAFAVEPRMSIGNPSLSFENGKANCIYYINTNNPNDKINVTMHLYRGLTLVDSWSASGYKSVSMSKTATAYTGATYQLTVNVSINDGTPSSSSVSKYYG